VKPNEKFYHAQGKVRGRFRPWGVRWKLEWGARRDLATSHGPYSYSSRLLGSFCVSLLFLPHAFSGKIGGYIKIGKPTNRRWGRSVVHHRKELTTGLGHENDPAASSRAQ
jgi:hypothetical protein